MTESPRERDIALTNLLITTQVYALRYHQALEDGCSHPAAAELAHRDAHMALGGFLREDERKLADCRVSQMLEGRDDG